MDGSENLVTAEPADAVMVVVMVCLGGEQLVEAAEAVDLLRLPAGAVARQVMGNGGHLAVNGPYVGSIVH